MIMSSGVDELVLFLNKKFTDLFGYTIKDIPDVSRWWPLAYPDERYRQEIKSQWSARIAKAIKEKGEIEPLEATVTCKDGGQRCVQFHSSSIGERNLVIFIDMTERKQAEEELRKSESLLKTVLSNAPITIFATDNQGMFTLSEGKGLQTVGMKPGENVGASALDLYGSFPFIEETGEEITGKEMINRALAGRTMTLLSDLHGVIFENRVGPLQDKDGGIIGVLGVATDVTERKQAENALHENQVQLDLALRSADMGVWHLDIIENKRYFDDQVCHLLGINPATFTGAAEEFLGAVHPDDRETIKTALARTIEQDVLYEPEYRAVWPDGSVHYITARGRLVRDDKGRPLRINGIIWDITKRRQAEQALHTSEAGLKEAQHLAKIGSWDWDATTNAISWSDEYYRIFGIEIGSPPPGYSDHLKAYTPESAARLDAAVKKSMEDGTPYELDLELARPTATTTWISTHCEVKRDADGKIVGLRGTTQNITDRKHAEEAVRESEEKFRTLFEDSKDTVIITSLEGKILDINTAGVELFGCGSRDELLQTNIGRELYVNPKDRKQMLRDMKQRGFLKNYDLHLKTGSGELLLVSASLTPELNDQGDTIGIRGVFHDMTEHQRLEEQLRQSQKLEGIGQLAGGIAHDFNNYLTAIEGYIDLALSDTPPDSPIYEDLIESRNSSERAANLARQLLIFSRRRLIHPKPINLNSVISDLLKMLERLIGEQYWLSTVLTDDPWTVSADASQIEQVIMNLAVNARDAMPAGGEIAISTENHLVDLEYTRDHPGSRPGEFFHIGVKDTGAGMDDKTMSHIFEPFYTTKAPAQGTGLGLSVVYGIITQHEGWIDVESNPGQGSTFHIFLPALPFQGSISETKPAELKRFRGRGEKVMLVEDEETVRNLGQKILSQNGYQVTTAASAEEAMKIFEESDSGFQLVFSDVILPKENGIDLVARLLERQPELKVLLVSGYSDIAAMETIRERGYPSLLKPYNLQALLKKIAELLA